VTVIALTLDHARLSPAEKRLTMNLALAARVLSAAGHDDFNQGQVSARLPGRTHFLIKSAQRGFSEATPDDVVVADVDSAVAPHPCAPPELPLHQAIYAARADVNAIVHSHAPSTLVFGALDAELAALSHDGAVFVGRVTRFVTTSNTILSRQIGDLVAEELADNPAVFLRNHGGVVVGKSLRHATVYAQLLERACQLQLAAMATGVPFHASTAADVAAKLEYIYRDTSVKSYWEYSLRQIRQASQEARSWI
jgi:L-fuculose-phosphate aldolase